MSYYESSKLKTPRQVCSCAGCGTKNLLLVRTNMIGSPEYCIEHAGYCKVPYHYTRSYTKVNAAVKAWNAMNEECEERYGFDRIWFEVDRVYEDRWDCPITPEGVRRAA